MVDGDEAISAAIRGELEEGLRSLASRRDFEGRVTESTNDNFGRTTFELAGRYAEFPDREVMLVVELDPARKGWRLDADLYEYPDSEDQVQLFRGLGGSRDIYVELAIESGRGLARAGWAAMLLYPTRHSE